jgi:ubiquinone/menaquinone biosynthesis C-methylase UbiE
MSLIDYIGRQFHNPQGFGGKLTTWIMNAQNRALYDATEALLALSGSDKVLDVGFGNGWLLERISKRYGCELYGIDTSPDSLSFATKRNRRYIQEGRMSLSLADALSTGFADTAFSKVYTVNTVYFWDDLDKGLAEMYRILKPGGTFINTLYTKDTLDKLPMTRQGYTKYSLTQLSDVAFPSNHRQFRAAEHSALYTRKEIYYAKINYKTRTDYRRNYAV